jgi:diguanylate cyclase (GGDEF)-like protein
MRLESIKNQGGFRVEMSIRFKLGLLLSTLFFAAIGNILLVFTLDGYGDDELEWVIHTHEILIESEQLIGAMKDAETGQRGYLLTLDAEYLEPYHVGMSTSKAHRERLVYLTSDNLEQKKRLENVGALMKRKHEELEFTISLAQENTSSSMSKALDVVRNNSGKKFMDAIRIEIIKFKSKELVLLEQRKGTLRERRAYMSALAIFGFLFFIFLAVVTVIFIQRKLYKPFYNKSQLLAHEANHDLLTGLANRAKLYKDLKEQIGSLVDDSKLVLLFIDINKFKEINDTLGHDAGDAILVEAARRFILSVRKKDSVYRFGGDEFIVLLTGMSDVSNVKVVVEELINNFSQPFNYNYRNIEITLSIGAAISPDDTLDREQLIKISDIAMYASKRSRGTNCTFFDKTMLHRESDK